MEQRRRQGINEQAVLQKRQRNFEGKLAPENAAWLADSAVTYRLADASKALRMVLDYAMQEFVGDELFKQGGFSKEETDQEAKAYVLDVSHVLWLESTASERGFASSSALTDYVIGVAKKADSSLVFELERAQRRVRATSVRFSIKS